MDMCSPAIQMQGLNRETKRCVCSHYLQLGSGPFAEPESQGVGILQKSESMQGMFLWSSLLSPDEKGKQLGSPALEKLSSVPQLMSKPEHSPGV